MTRTLNIPVPNRQIFTGGIRHPDLFLWDAWSCNIIDGNGVENIHLYCLAVNRLKNNGEPLLPKERNSYTFHIRHFISSDSGCTWIDKGAFQRSALASDGHDARNVWSGSVMPTQDGRVLAAYTGIYEAGEQNIFRQNLAAGIVYDSDSFGDTAGQLLLCPVRDEEKIRAAGYFMSDRERLGDRDGEQSGPILAWRDPFVFRDPKQKKLDKQLVMLWAAKPSATQAAIGMATIKIDSNSKMSVDKIFAPILLPDGDQFTQIELPKIYFDSVKDRYILIVATTTRESESQSDEQVVKRIRLYTSDSIDGDWVSSGIKDSALEGIDNIFGMTVLKTDFEMQKLYCIAPYTEAASTQDELTFASVFEINLSQIRQAEKLTVSLNS